VFVRIDPILTKDSAMLKKIIFPMALALLTLSYTCWAAAAKGYVAGSGEAVKSWTPRAYDALNGGFQPLIIYIYDHEPKKNTVAMQVEGKDGLSNADLKDKLSKFGKIKIKSDGTDAKGWPEDLRKGADKAATLILRSADGKMQMVFTKTEHKLPELLAAAVAIQAYEDKAKAQAAKEDKKAQAIAAANEKPKEKEPDLTIKIDEKKPEPKVGAKDAKKPADKVADAKPSGGKPGETKMDDKKKPQDE
jgi:hypothetical protein